MDDFLCNKASLPGKYLERQDSALDQISHQMGSPSCPPACSRGATGAFLGHQVSRIQSTAATSELELELIQTHMTQKPLLWVEVGVHAVHKRSGCAGVVWAGAGAHPAQTRARPCSRPLHHPSQQPPQRFELPVAGPSQAAAPQPPPPPLPVATPSTTTAAVFFSLVLSAKLIYVRAPRMRVHTTASETRNRTGIHRQSPLQKSPTRSDQAARNLREEVVHTYDLSSLPPTRSEHESQSGS